MNESLQNKLSEVIGVNNISYIINNNMDFSVTGYKVMQNQSNSGLIKCAKIMYNGKIKLVYIIEGKKPLSFVATRFGVNELNAVIFNLIQRAMDIKANGFFRAENLELDFNKIFVDTSDYSVHFIYFPLSSGITGKSTAFENEFRVALIKLFNSFPVFTAPQFQRLCSELANGSLPLDVILKKLQDSINGNNYNKVIYENNVQPEYSVQRSTPIIPNGEGYSVYNNQIANNQVVPYEEGYHRKEFFNMEAQVQPQVQSVNRSFVQQPVLTITAINSPVQVVLTVNQPEYLIGKNPNMVNGAVIHNPAISRVHCKISYASGKYYLTDMGSANGTFVNQQRLNKQQTVELNRGDYLKLANSEFVVSF
ncbi:MAG: FHA domain-containing protein [Ruminococcus sp.]|nr:FHA domain-containing protein [Ruminococcus sp.]